jgi:hypothetical protein
MRRPPSASTTATSTATGLRSRSCPSREDVWKFFENLHVEEASGRVRPRRDPLGGDLVPRERET